MLTEAAIWRSPWTPSPLASAVAAWLSAKGQVEAGGVHVERDLVDVGDGGEGRQVVGAGGAEPEDRVNGRGLGGAVDDLAGDKVRGGGHHKDVGAKTAGQAIRTRTAGDRIRPCAAIDGVGSGAGADGAAAGATRWCRRRRRR